MVHPKHSIAACEASAQTIRDIPPEYIDERDRAVYVARALAGEDCYAYTHPDAWIVWDGAISPWEEQRIEFRRRDGVPCSCCGALTCECSAWRDTSGLCVLHGWKLSELRQGGR